MPHSHSLLLRSRVSFHTVGSSSKGFALVIALGLMAFVVLLLLTISTLVQVEQMGADAARQEVQAEQMALLSLNMAIGKLQETAGLDQRVTASAESLASVNGPKQLTGAWRSWEGSDHDSVTGLPTVPDYDSKTKRYQTATATDGRFLGWLVSSAYNPLNTASSSADADAWPSLLEVDGTTVPLLGTGSVGEDDSDYAKENEVHLVPTDIDDGAYAWWVQGLNTKALIEQAEPLPDEDAFAEWANRQNSNPHYDSDSFGIPDSDALDKLFSLGAFDLADPTGTVDVGSIAEENYHSLTHYSRGLLTNVATGGWKRDISLFAEKWEPGDYLHSGDNPDYRTPWGEAVPEDGFSTFNLSPGVSNVAGLKTVESGDDALLYGWATLDDTSMTWNSLADFASLYKNLQQDANGNHYYNFYNSLGTNSNGKSIMTGERFSIVEPMIVRWQTILSLASERVTTTGDVIYVPLVGVHPSVTYYNPYNVAIDSTGYNHDYLQIDDNAFPIGLTFQIDSGSSVSPWKMPILFGMNTADNHENRWNVKPNISNLEDKKWKPGECRILGSPSLNGITGGTSTININTGMSDRPYFTRIRNSLSAANQSKILEDGYGGDASFKVSWTRDTHSGKVPGWLRTSTTRVTYARTLNYHVSTDPSQIDEKSPINQADTSFTDTLGSIVWDEDYFEPFLSMALTKRNLLNSYATSKGYMNNKLILSPGATTGLGIEQASFEWKIDRLNGKIDVGTENYIRELSAGDDVSGFVGTSSASDNGLARWVTAELPTSPLLSLCELQHFDPALTNTQPPLVANALGNSHATPFIRNNEIQVTGTEGYDHSYVFNHIMFDDWFVSSISPDLDPFSANIVADREIDNVLKEFFIGARSLKNTNYLPAVVFAEAGDATTYIDDTYKNSGTSWATVASDLEVNGMFNVNSTSVEAWKALLRNVKGGKVPHQTIDTTSLGSWTMEQQDPSYEAPVSRTSVVGDEFSAGNDAQLLAQPLDWTDDQIDALAEEIVNQIKLRGPFLSLSEFINRQLTTDEDLAMAGAVESALITLSEYGAGDSKNPYGEILTAFPEDEMDSYETADGNPVEYPKYLAREFSDHEDYYEFPKAAEGHVAYGTPGWSRQADILRPIAPVLSARDDSFTIRCYGASKDITGSVASEAWCEATVQRTAEYVDPTNDKTDYTNLTASNASFGRKFKVISFRWLTQDEL